MQGIVGALLRQFGPLSEAGSPPNVPTLIVVDNGDGTATATISGSSDGSVNIIYAQHSSSLSWEIVGTRNSDGEVTLTLDNGRYFGYVESSLNEQETVSSVILFWMLGSGESILVHSPADIVGWMMCDMGVGTFPADDDEWPVWINGEPDEPDEVMTVRDTSGRLDGRTLNDGQVQEHYGIQIRFRATRADRGWTKAHEVVTSLDEHAYNEVVAIDSSQYIVYSISRTGGILNLGKEKPNSARNLWTVNAVVALRKIS